MVSGSLRNPYAVVAISLIVVILGVVSYQKMEVDVFPEINLPVVAVATFYKGMGPTQLEGAITLRLEQLLLQASYVEHIESRSLPGVSLIKVFFHPSYDVNAAVAEVTSLTYSTLKYLPPGVFPPIIVKFSAASMPIGVLTGSSDTASEKEVRDNAYYKVRPQMANIPGIFVASSFGGTVRQITVFLDRERMLARGLSAQEIVSAVNAQSLLLPAGGVKIGDFDYNVYANSLVEVVDRMNDIPIKIVNGVPIRLQDIAKAVDSTMIQGNVVRVNGKRAVYMPILKQAGANTIAVMDGVKEMVPKLTGLPADYVTKLLFDQSLYIRQAIHTLEEEGLIGGGLACLMVLLFLGSFRATFVIALAVPLSILGAFTLLKLSGQSINVMTLGGLALVIGTLLDNNIVVLENVFRHLGMGKSVKQASGDGTAEVALPMLVITLSILIVYLPIMFFTGIIRFLFVPLALAVAYTMLSSYLASMTVAPVTIMSLIKGETHGMRWFNAVFDWFVARYTNVLAWCLDHRTLVVLVSITGLAISLVFATRLATEFFPKVDAGQFIINVSAPEGTRVEKTEALVGQIEDIVREEIPAGELDQIVSNIGLPHGWMVLYTPVTGPHQAFMLVSMNTGHTAATTNVIDRVRARVTTQFPGVKLTFQSGGIISDVLNAGLPAPIDLKLVGRKLSDLYEAAGKIRAAVADIPGTEDVQVRQGSEYPELFLTIDRDRAVYFGLTEQQVVRDILTSLSSNGQLNPGYWVDPKSSNAYFVVTQYPEQTLVQFDDFLNMPLAGRGQDLPGIASAVGMADRGSALALQQTPFANRAALPQPNRDGAGSPVVLRDLVEVDRRTGPETVDHYNLQRSVDVLVSVSGNDLGRVAGRVEETLAHLELPEGISVLTKGEADSMRSALEGFGGALPLAIVLVYLVMVGLFRSFVDPLVILGAVPLGFIGVIWMLLLTGTSVNVESLIGSLMMIGIVVSNSVLLVDFANRQLLEGLPLKDALIQAGRLRVRPILMTALATILGLAPMALALGEGSEMNAPLARAVIGGLLAGTPMTLLVIPVFHALARRRQLTPASGETTYA
ncbi:RND transporter [Nitrospira sp.]|nr:RND transporter [Nitrospira sp.]